MNKPLMLVMTLALCGNAAAAHAASPEPPATQIMSNNYMATKVKWLRSDATMTLHNDRGQSRVRKITISSKLQSNGTDSNILIRFRSPADIAGTAFLQIEQAAGDDDLWIYLPALKKSRRLVANNRRDSFVGSDFSYGDILLPKVALYRHKLLGTEVNDGHDCYVVESVPAESPTARDNGYGRKITWVRKDNFVESRVDYYDEDGQLYKTQATADHRPAGSSGRWVVAKRSMVNHLTGHSTEFVLERIDVDTAIPDKTFTTRALERE